MIVVMIIGIAAALALPMLTQDTSTKVIAAAQLLAADLAYAQIESIAHGDDPRVVVFDNTNHKYFITTESAIAAAVGAGGTALTATPITNPVGNTNYVTTFGKTRALALTGVQIGAYALGGDNQLKFLIYGQTDMSANATITLTCSGKSITVTVDPVSGEASIGNVS